MIKIVSKLKEIKIILIKVKKPNFWRNKIIINKQKKIKEK